MKRPPPRFEPHLERNDKQRRFHSDKAPQYSSIHSTHLTRNSNSYSNDFNRSSQFHSNQEMSASHSSQRFNSPNGLRGSQGNTSHGFNSHTLHSNHPIHPTHTPFNNRFSNINDINNTKGEPFHHAHNDSRKIQENKHTNHIHTQNNYQPNFQKNRLHSYVSRDNYIEPRNEKWGSQYNSINNVRSEIQNFRLPIPDYSHNNTTQNANIHNYHPSYNNKNNLQIDEFKNSSERIHPVVNFIKMDRNNKKDSENLSQIEDSLKLRHNSDSQQSSNTFLNKNNLSNYPTNRIYRDEQFNQRRQQFEINRQKTSQYSITNFNPPNDINFRDKEIDRNKEMVSPSFVNSRFINERNFQERNEIHPLERPRKIFFTEDLDHKHRSINPNLLESQHLLEAPKSTYNYFNNPTTTNNNTINTNNLVNIEKKEIHDINYSTKSKQLQEVVDILKNLESRESSTVNNEKLFNLESENHSLVSNFKVLDDQIKEVIDTNLESMEDEPEVGSNFDKEENTPSIRDLIISALDSFPNSSIFQECSMLFDFDAIDVDEELLTRVIKLHGGNIAQINDHTSWEHVTHYITSEEKFQDPPMRGRLRTAKTKSNIVFVSIRWILTSLIGKILVDPNFFALKDKEESDEDVSESEEDIDNQEPTDKKISTSKLKPLNFTKIKKNQYIGATKNIIKGREIETDNCHCLPHAKILNDFNKCRGDKCCGEDCENRLSHFECLADDIHEECKNKRFQQKKWVKTKVKATPKKGFGLFAGEKIQEGEFVMEYVGEIIDDSELEARKGRYAAEGRPHYYFITLEQNMTIDATLKGCNARFINHSCDPNCETQKWTVGKTSVIGIFTLRDIKRGEELTFDYGFERFGGVGQKCYCGSKNCRGFIEAKKKDPEITQKARLKNIRNTFNNLVDKIILLEVPDKSSYEDLLEVGCQPFLWRNVMSGFRRIEKQIKVFEEQLTEDIRQEEREEIEIQNLQSSLHLTYVQARKLFRQMQDEKKSIDDKSESRKNSSKLSENSNTSLSTSEKKKDKSKKNKNEKKDKKNNKKKDNDKEIHPNKSKDKSEKKQKIKEIEDNKKSSKNKKKLKEKIDIDKQSIINKDKKSEKLSKKRKLDSSSDKPRKKRKLD